MFAGTTTIPVNGADDANANGQNPTTNYSVEIDATIKTEADTTIKCEVVDGITTMPSIQQAGKVYVGPGAQNEAKVLGLGLTKLRSYQKDDLERARRYAMEQSVKHVLMKQQVAHQQNQQKIAMYSQALSLMARVYIGSINFDIREDQIRQTFSAFGPIKSINMSYDAVTGHHKGFAFLEFEVPEGAQLAQDNMNAKMMGGRNLKVGRAQTMPQAQPIIDMIMTEALNYHRVYVASVHPQITEKDLRNVFEAFGEVVKCQLAKQPMGKAHRGFGYIEFTNAQAVREAIEGMNGFDLGGQYLQVGKCITPPDAITYLTMQGSKEALPTAAAVAAATATAKIQARELETQQQSSGSGSESGRSSPSLLHKTNTSPNRGSNSPAHIPNSQTNASLVAAATVINGSAGSPTPAIVQPPTTAPIGGGRRRGFGGFASAASVPPAGLIHSLPSVGVVELPSTLGPPTVSTPPTTTSQPQPKQISVQPSIGSHNRPLPPPLPKVLLASQTSPSVVPIISKSESAAQQTNASIQPQYQSAVPNPVLDQSLDSFYSILEDPTFEPPSLPAVGTDQPATISAPQPKPAKKEKEKKDIFDRIGERLIAQQQQIDITKPAKFGPLEPQIAPRDPSAFGEEGEDGIQLAITGPEAQRALALRQDGALTKVQRNKGKRGGPGESGDQSGPSGSGRKRKSKPKKSSVPKLNTAQALNAANIAGAISDQLQAANVLNDEASLASQESVQIRGNDARHLLIQKLMRTNRSSVIVLKNMVTASDVDEYLEEEVREECGKFGNIVDVVIVQEQDAENVKIFVRFGEPVQADEAKKALNGRFFGGRTIIAENYDQTLFEHEDFTA